MTVFLDTNVLIAAMVRGHQFHERSFAVLQRVHEKKADGVVSAHSLAEVYATLTKLPPPDRHAPEQALLSIEENILKHFTISSLNGNEYAELIRESALAGVQGGTVYDALHLKSAEKANADRVYTLNLKHFEAIAPKSFGAKIIAP